MAMPESLGLLTGHVAMVTGSSSGIGRAIALELARGGADVIIHCHRSVATAQTVAGEVRVLGRHAQVIAADLAVEDELPRLVDAAWDCLHSSPTIWVNNAGADLLTGDDAHLPFGRKLERLYHVDVRGTLVLSRIVGARLRESGRGTILNIGWDQAETGMEGDSGELFAAAKGAVMAFTRSLALSLAPEVRVNCIAPGWIRTAWGEQTGESWQRRVLRETPLGRWGSPEDVARLARFLVSDDAAYLTGQVINANGGAVR